MRRKFCSLMVAFVLAGCGGPESDLEGTWKFSPEMIESDLEQVPPNARARARDEMERVRMTFKNGTFKYEAPGAVTAEGTYRVIDVVGNTLTILTKTSDGKTEEQTIEIEGDTFTTTLRRRKATLVRVE